MTTETTPSADAKTEEDVDYDKNFISLSDLAKENWKNRVRSNNMPSDDEVAWKREHLDPLVIIYKCRSDINSMLNNKQRKIKPPVHDRTPRRNFYMGGSG